CPADRRVRGPDGDRPHEAAPVPNGVRGDGRDDDALLGARPRAGARALRGLPERRAPSAGDPGPVLARRPAARVAGAARRGADLRRRDGARPAAADRPRPDHRAARLIVLTGRELTLVYRDAANEVRAVDGVSLEVKEGEFVAILG